MGAPGDINGTGTADSLHPMKGPMATQTLRGMVNHGPMHWRGDRVTGYFGTDMSTAPPYNSTLAFKNFIQAFNTLVGLGPMFSTSDMDTYTEFALAIATPPNAVRNLDRSLTASQATGRSFFLGCDGNDTMTSAAAACGDAGTPTDDAGHFSDGQPGYGFTCQGCHVLNPAMGFFGTDGESSYEALPQIMKVPQLRNLYEKVGMFGVPADPRANPGNNGNLGPQVRGVGFTNDGSVDAVPLPPGDGLQHQLRRRRRLRQRRHRPEERRAVAPGVRRGPRACRRAADHTALGQCDRRRASHQPLHGSRPHPFRLQAGRHRGDRMRPRSSGRARRTAHVVPAPVKRHVRP